MSKKRINLMVDEDLDKRWKAVAKKIKMSKSAMLESMLENSLPTLEKDSAEDMISSMLKEIGKVMNDTGSLFSEKK